jgi:enterochelin esterase family protein
MEVVRGGRGGARNRDLWKQNTDKFSEILLTEVMPRAEKAYHIASEPRAHAIAGLSMGGAESLLTGLNRLERFGWIGAFSSGGLGTNYSVQFPKLAQKRGAELRLLWIACGEQDGLLANNLQFVEWLKSQNVPCTWVQTPGQHSFRVWRRNLAQFASLLFR